MKSDKQIARCSSLYSTSESSALGYSTVAIGKAWAACVQSFALWQQATIKFMRRNHSIVHLLLCAMCTYSIVVLRTHPVRGESHIQRNTTREVATVHI